MAEGDSAIGGYVQLPADCVTMCAESLGITQLSQDVVPALAEDVNYRVREATQVSFRVSEFFAFCYFAIYYTRMQFNLCGMLNGES